MGSLQLAPVLKFSNIQQCESFSSKIQNSQKNEPKLRPNDSAVLMSLEGNQEIKLEATSTYEEKSNGG